MNIRIINYFKCNTNNHELWFENGYLKSLGLCNKRIQKKDFEGIICSDKGQELAIFELKLISFPNIQKEVSREFSLADKLILYPKQNAIRSSLREHISRAKKQVIEKRKDLILPRIIFLIIDTPNIRPDSGVSVVSAIKGRRAIIFPEGKSIFESETSNNEKITNLFYDKNLSGVVCLYITIPEDEYDLENPIISYKSSVIKNIEADNQISNEFLVNATIIEV